MIDKARAAKVGRRYHAFYLGWKACHGGKPIEAKPFADGTEASDAWSNGWQMAQQEKTLEPA
jgi:ribosome modulation factor